MVFWGSSYVPMIHWTLISLTFSMEECSRFLITLAHTTLQIVTFQKYLFLIFTTMIISYIKCILLVTSVFIVLQVYLEYPHDHTPEKSQGYHSSLPGTVLPPPGCCVCTSPQQMLGCHGQQ